MFDGRLIREPREQRVSLTGACLLETFEPLDESVFARRDVCRVRSDRFSQGLDEGDFRVSNARRTPQLIGRRVFRKPRLKPLRIVFCKSDLKFRKSKPAQLGSPSQPIGLFTHETLLQYRSSRQPRQSGRRGRRGNDRALRQKRRDRSLRNLIQGPTGRPPQ